LRVRFESGTRFDFIGISLVRSDYQVAKIERPRDLDQRLALWLGSTFPKPGSRGKPSISKRSKGMKSNGQCFYEAYNRIDALLWKEN
jgi:hypothetical protein